MLFDWLSKYGLYTIIASSFDIILVLFQIGLQAWTTALDANQQTPHGYALMRNNHTYNRLVEQKLADQRRAQVSITISKEPTLNKTKM